MKKIRTIIIEDESASLYMLKEELIQYQNIEIIGEYRDGEDGLSGINTQKPDLVFVDIEMPEMDGFAMLRLITCNPVIIFYTGHKKYALEAWDYHAADFIIKPLDSKRLKLALEKAIDDIKNKRQDERLRNQKIFAGLIELTWNDPDGKKSRFFSPDEIIYIQADRDYLRIFLSATPSKAENQWEKTIIIKKTIKAAANEWEKHGFLQVHKSYLINFSKVIEWDKSAKKIVLQETSESISIGRAFIKKFQQKWSEQLV